MLDSKPKETDAFAYSPDNEPEEPLTHLAGTTLRNDSQEIFYDVPEKLTHPFQYVCIGLLWLIFTLLLVFIAYISATWNKDRTNEYT